MKRAQWRALSFTLGLLLVVSAVFIGDGHSTSRADPEADAAVEKGVAFLLEHQHADGSWGESTVGRSYEILAAVPGSHRAFQVATTALCVMAIRNSRIESEEARRAVRKGLEFLIRRARVSRPNGMEMYNVWAFGYGLRCLSEAVFSGEYADLNDRMRAAAEKLITALKLYQVPDGGWGYYDFDVQSYRPSYTSMSFTTSTEVISLYAAKQVGISIPEKMLDKALLSLHRARRSDGSYLYGWYLRYAMGHPVNKIKGSTCRTSSCHLAQYLFNDHVGYADLVKGIEDLIENHHFSDIARKRPVPHEAWYANSGYFYLYGHYYASMVLQHLKPEDQARLWPPLRQWILGLQEPDGSWWDYPLYGYHKYYGTAYALLTLCWDRYGKELYAKSVEPVSG